MINSYDLSYVLKLANYLLRERKTQMSYDYISVASDLELISAFTLVMKEVDSSLAVKMASYSLVSYENMPNTMRSICLVEEEIKNLVNNKIEEERVVEVLEREKIRSEENKITQHTLYYLTTDEEKERFLDSLAEKVAKAKES